MSSTGLVLRDIWAGYGSSSVLKNICLTVNDGDFLSLLGPNGEGKTTLLKVLCGLKKARSGQVTLDGRDLSSFTHRQLAGIMAYVPQNHQPGMPFSVLDMVLLGCVHRHSAFSKPRHRDYEMAQQSLNELGIDHLASKSYSKLSGGEQRLVLLARALTQNARFIILDEPVSNLDLGNQIRVLRVLHKLSLKGIGIILSSHFPEHSLWLNNRTAILRSGGISADDLAGKVITEKTLSELYGTEICVIQHSNGTSHCEPRFVQEIAR